MLDALRPDDAAEMIRIARENNQPNWTYQEGAAGTVVRDGDRLRGFCLLRETAYGFVVDELWCERTREGIASLVTLAEWMESVVQRMASERGHAVQLGGIVRLDNPKHKHVLERRGYAVTAEILAKEFLPEGLS